MKLLICTQAVDRSNPTLGFFHRWIEEFAKHCSKIIVICLRKGEYDLPNNVKIFSLGKEEGGVSRFHFAWRFLKLIWSLRKEYDAVFVHMNPEYMVLGGVCWRMMGKRVSLWYTHKSVDLKLRIATFFAHIIFTASRESFRLSNHKIQVVGHGIDTTFFSPGPGVIRGEWILSAGRLSKSKRHDLAIQHAAEVNKVLYIAGEGPERTHLESLARKLKVEVHFLGGLTQEKLRDEYRTAAYFIHTSETGSLDKVVLEALACGCPVYTNDPALKYLERADYAYVREHHSLQSLIPEILARLR